MKERPILFSGPMVRAILDGKKTQTRRVVKPQPGDHPSDEGYGAMHRCPYEVGMRLWVRETWRMAIADSPGCGREVGIEYRSDDEIPSALWSPRRKLHHCGESQDWLWCRWSQCSTGHYLKWKPSIYMPRWASRLTLDIVSVRVERLQDISESDALDEGCDLDDLPNGAGEGGKWHCPTAWYRELWDSINAKSHPWESNPWVWVIEFKVVPQ